MGHLCEDLKKKIKFTAIKKVSTYCMLCCGLITVIPFIFAYTCASALRSNADAAPVLNLFYRCETAWIPAIIFAAISLFCSGICCHAKWQLTENGNGSTHERLLGA